MLQRCSVTMLGLAVACSANGTGAPASEPATTAGTAGVAGVASTQPVLATTLTVPATTVATAATTVSKATAPTTQPTAPSPAGVTSVVVDSTPDKYFVLYVKPNLNAVTEIPVSITIGKAGTTALTDGRNQLPKEHYRVATFSVASPGDIDGDGANDLTELADPVNANPFNPAPRLDPANGAVIVPDKASFERLSYQGDDVARDAYLAGIEFMKFWIIDIDKAHPSIYFMNTEAFRAHPQFASVVGISGGRGPSADKMRGDVAYDAYATAADGSKGRYRFAFQPNDAYTFEQIALAYELLVTSMPVLKNNLSYLAFAQAGLPLYKKEKASYDAYRVPVIME